MADVPAGFEVVKTASGAPPGFEVVKPGASTLVVDKSGEKTSDSEEPKRAFGDLFKDPNQKPGTVSTPDYMVDQFDRAPGKFLDFLTHGLKNFANPGAAIADQVLEAHGLSKPLPKFGEKINETLLGKEPAPASVGQAIAGAGASALATPGGSSAFQTLKNLAISGAFGSSQQAVTEGLVKLGMSREVADKLTLAMGLGASFGASRLANSVGKTAAEKTAIEKTEDYVARREAVNQTATENATPKATQEALKAAQQEQMQTLQSRDEAAAATQKTADKHVENTIAAFQPNSSLGELGQASLSKLNDTVRDQVKAQAQGTLQKVMDIPRVDVSEALGMARKYEKDFSGRDAVADSAGGVAANILNNTKENLGKTDAPVGAGKISSTLRNKITTDTATVDGKTLHNLIGDINDRIEGKGKYAAEKTPDVANLIAIKRALVAAGDKAGNGAYSQFLGDYAKGMAKLDPFQRGQAADKVTMDMDYGRSKVMGPGQAAETLLPKGMKGGDTAARIQTLMGDNPEFQQAVKSYVGQKLSDLKASPGGLTPQKFAQFQRDYGPAMKSYGLDKSVATVQDAVQAAAVREAEVNAIRKTTETQRDRYNNSALGKAAGVADASMVLDPIMQGDRSARLSNMRQAVQAIQKSPQSAAAMDGLRSKFNQYFFDHPEQSEDLALMAQKSGLYSPEQAANIRKVAEQIRGENAQSQAARMVRGGMPTLENSASVANYIVRKVGFIALSSGIGTIAGGPIAGAATGAAALTGQSLIARQKQMTIDAIAKIIEDPKMAKIMASKPDKGNAFLADHLARQIAADVVRKNSQQDQQDNQ